jgi:hypothetical protein
MMSKMPSLLIANSLYFGRACGLFSLLGFERKSSGRGRRAATAAKAGDQQDDEDDDEQEEQDLRHAGEGGGQPAEAEHAGYNRQDEKENGPTKHQMLSSFQLLSYFSDDILVCGKIAD